MRNRMTLSDMFDGKYGPPYNDGKFIMKQNPVFYNDREQKEVSISLYSSTSIDEAKKQLEKLIPSDHRMCFEKCKIEFDDYDGGCSVYLTYSYEETDSQYQERLSNFNKEMEKYNKWYEKNKKKIEKIREEERKLKEEQELKQAERNKISLIKQLQKIEKDLQRLNKKKELINDKVDKAERKTKTTTERNREEPQK